jgi:hypothetical protein
MLECPQPVPLLFRVPTTPSPSRERQSGRGELNMEHKVTKTYTITLGYFCVLGIVIVAVLLFL